MVWYPTHFWRPCLCWESFFIVYFQRQVSVSGISCSHYLCLRTPWLGSAITAYFLNSNIHGITSCTIDGIPQNITDGEPGGVICKNKSLLVSGMHNITIKTGADMAFDGFILNPTLFPESGVDVIYGNTSNAFPDVGSNLTSREFRFHGEQHHSSIMQKYTHNLRHVCWSLRYDVLRTRDQCIAFIFDGWCTITGLGRINQRRCFDRSLFWSAIHPNSLVTFGNPHTEINDFPSKRLLDRANYVHRSE